MGQAYATTFEFNGIEHAILISDRHPPHERLASFYEDHKDFDPYSELNKVQLCGKLAVVTDPIILDFSDKKFSNEHVGLDFDLLQGYACIETEQFEG